MKTVTLRVSIARLILSLCLATVLVSVNSPIVRAQAFNGCPPFESWRPHWAQSSTVYVMLASNIDPNTIVPQMVAGFQAWNNANQNHNNSRVNFSFALPIPPACANKIHVSYRPLLLPNGQVDSFTVAKWFPTNPYHSKSATHPLATLRVNRLRAFRSRPERFNRARRKVSWS